MHTVYVLRSLKSGKRYVGVTSQPIVAKVREHNEGATTWSRMYKPFELVYCETKESKPEALRRERFLKSGDGRRVLDRLIKESLK